MPGQGGPSEIPSVFEVELEVEGQDNPIVDNRIEVVQHALENIVILAQDIIDALNDLIRGRNAARGGYHPRPQHPHEIRAPAPHVRFLRPAGLIEGAVRRGNLGQRPRPGEILFPPARLLGRPIQAAGVFRQPAHQGPLAVIGAEAHQPVAMGAEAVRPLAMGAKAVRQVAVDAEVDPLAAIDAEVDRPVAMGAEVDRPVAMDAEVDRPFAIDADVIPPVANSAGTKAVPPDTKGVQTGRPATMGASPGLLAVSVPQRECQFIVPIKRARQHDLEAGSSGQMVKEGSDDNVMDNNDDFSESSGDE